MNTKLVEIHRNLAFLYAVVPLVIGGVMAYGGSAEMSMLLVYVPLLGLALLHWAAAKGTKKGSLLGRRLSKGLGGLLLFGFPVGTAIGLALLKRAGSEWQGQATR
jgi:hypothetical protein